MKILEGLQLETDEYCQALERFLQRYDLFQLILQPIDHIAIETADSVSFETFLKRVGTFASSLEYFNDGGRRIASAVLSKSILCGRFGTTDTLEIMEPRPHKVGKDRVGFEHVEFYHHDLDAIRSALQQRGVEFISEENDFHKTVVCVINDLHQEIKFTSSRLLETLKLERDRGLLVQLK